MHGGRGQIVRYVQIIINGDAFGAGPFAPTRTWPVHQPSSPPLPAPC